MQYGRLQLHFSFRFEKLILENFRGTIMSKTGRDYLVGQIKLSRNTDGTNPEEYYIKSVIGEGGSCVCYDAVRKLNNGMIETGKLKEFYPIDYAIGNEHKYYSLERVDGQLYPNAGTVRKFDIMCEEFIESYRVLREVIVENQRNETLHNYIQIGEVLYGLPRIIKYESGDQEIRKSTVYIWSGGYSGEGFDKYLEKVKKNPAVNPEKNLENILSAVYNLTDCIKAMHTAGLMHLDIKPSNFMVQSDTDSRIRPDSISLFDVNTLCSVHNKNKFKCAAGTRGFSAPEIMLNKPFDNRSDIYSIGAMLYNAIVINNDLQDDKYYDEYYSEIQKNLMQSELIKSSDINSDSHLVAGLCNILQKCLAKSPAKRYQYCAQLKEDLKKVLIRINKILWTPVVKNQTGIIDSDVIIQKMLYDYPLYKSVPDGQKKTSVLVIGAVDEFRSYSHKFIDYVLQVGQTVDNELEVISYSDDAEQDKADYLSFRPDLNKFVNVNGSLSGKEITAYASLEFRSISRNFRDEELNLKYTVKNSQYNSDIVENIFDIAERNNKKFDYIFVAIGNDSVSGYIARRCAEKISYSCTVCYIRQNNKKMTSAEKNNRLYPIFINRPVDFLEDEEIGRMAFNTHISWYGKLGINVAAEKEKFFYGKKADDRYNRNSSIAFVLSVKYKLQSIKHILSDAEINDNNFQELSEKFFEKILKKRNKDTDTDKIFNQLVYFEHRRWVLDKVTNGWSAPFDENGNLKLDECISRGSVKDHVNLTHPCIVRSTEETPLYTEEYRTDNLRKWDEGDVSELDELDRMSVELHRCFKKAADEILNNSRSFEENLRSIRFQIPASNTESIRCFNQFCFVLRNILNGDRRICSQYENYHKAFLKSINTLPVVAKEMIEKRLQVIKHEIFPVIERNLYRDYKSYDVILIEKIPFILTYRYPKSVAMAFEDGKYFNGSNESSFDNVAAATLLAPETIHYLYMYNEDSDTDNLCCKLKSALNYFRIKNINCSAELLVISDPYIQESELTCLSCELDKIKNIYADSDENNCFIDYRLIRASDYEKTKSIVLDYLEEKNIDLYNGSTRLFTSEFENTNYVYSLIKKNISYFEFAWRKKKFNVHVNCDYLKYIEDSSYISVRDMFSLSNATDNKYNLPEFSEDYQKLWEVYSGKHLCKGDDSFRLGVQNWNMLCSSLEEYNDNSGILTTIKNISKKETDGISTSQLEFFLPDFSFETTKMILDKLIEYNIVQSESEIINYTSDTCKLIINVSKDYQKNIEELFSKPQYLMPYYNIKFSVCSDKGKRSIKITYEDLNVRNLRLDKNEANYRYQTLQCLQNHHFIRQLIKNEDDENVYISFKYSSPRIKSILTQAGEILEVYAYYEALKTGYFDDIASGFEFFCDDVNNEFDLILTKGFKSILIECKAVKNLEQNYYHKFNNLSNMFGIGSTKLLIGNTYRDYLDDVNEKNKLQRLRGNQMNIRTISDLKQIQNIGHILKEIMDED